MSETQLSHAPSTGAGLRLDPRPPAKRLVAGRAWIETSPGTLVWKGAPPPPPPPPFAEGDRVILTTTIKRDQRKLPRGTVCTVAGPVTPTLWSVTTVPPADTARGAYPSVWLVHVADLALVEDDAC